jgi:secondary thiamine-phosphate synthase enzyme
MASVLTRGSLRSQWRDRVGLAPTSEAAGGNVSCKRLANARLAKYSRVASTSCFCVTLTDMSKSSTVTVRERPVEDVATARVGGLTIHGETIVISTDQRIELVDLTNRIMEFVRKFNMREGLVSLWSMHTTCALFINEFQVALLSDIKRFLEQMVARDAEYMHNDPNHSDCDRMNADAHLRALLLGHNLTLQVSGGEVVLGQWQRILMAELDGPRARSLRIQIFGIS